MERMVPAGHVLRYGYAEHGSIAFEQYGGIYWPAVEQWLGHYVDGGGGAQPAHAPMGYWRSDERFVILDGRHRYVAAVIAGFQHILVCWLEPL
jgi:hypothetical protein